MSIQKLIEHQLMRLVPINGCYGVYGDFAQASAAAPSADRLGYDAANASSWYRERLTHVTHDDYPMLFWVEKALPDCKQVVEIGGHVGIAFYGFSKFVPFPANLGWTVVDVPSVTRAGAELARERREARLRFTNELPSPETPIDLLIASGSLQYVPGPLLPESVREMRQRPRHILIHKTPVIQGPGYVTLQCLGRAWCPYRIHGFDELITPLLEMGYELVDTWAKPRKLTIPLRPELKVEHYNGYYLRLAVSAVQSRPRSP